MKKVLIAGLFLGVSGCSFAPTYTRPDLPTAAQYREKTAEEGHWVPFKPTAETARTWWKAFHDPVLDDLEHSGLVANQNLLAALARLDQGRSLAREQWANLWPVIGASATHQKTKISEHTMIFPVQNYPAFQTNQVQLDLNYELDIWGALRNAAHAADAQARASADDLATLALSTEAEIALDYESLRALDVELSETEKLVNSWADNRTLTAVLVTGAEAATPDQAQADLNWQVARQQLNELRLQRERMEHALALLVGSNPEEFHIAPVAAELPTPLHPVPGMPSILLERRPDVVSAEEKVKAANANIGVAKAAWFPVFNLTAYSGYGNTGYGPLMVAPNRLWSFGPTLSLPLFNGGQIAAANDLARAQWEESVANYRNTVLEAWREVEDQLAALRELEEEAEAARGASKAAQLALEQARLRFEGGLANRFDVLQAERTAALALTGATQLRLRALASSIVLVKALGGGWSDSDSSDAAKPHSPAGAPS